MIEHTTMRPDPVRGWLALTAGCAALAFSTGAAAKNYSDWEPPVSAEVGSSSELNSPFNDGCPIQSPDGLDLYMATNRPGGPGGLDIWVAHRDSPDAGWGAPQPLPAPANSAADDFCPTPLRGNRLLFVSKRDEPNGDIYETRLNKKKGWETPTNLGPNVNSAAQEWSPSLFEDEQGHQVLYFSSTRGGNQDIYASVDFGPAHPVAELNTAADDARPNVSKDGREIVFDSTRGTPGNPDIWTATRESTSAQWSAPVAIPQLNTAKPESRATLSWDGLTMVFGSSREGGEGSADIFVTHRTREQGNFGKTIHFPGGG